MFRIGIIEDEVQETAKMKDFISLFLKKSGMRISVAFFSGSEQFFATDQRFDILLIDIILEGDRLTGMDIAETWRKCNPDGIIIFTTNMSQYALKSYRVNALNFLVKPIDYQTFEEKFQQAMNALNKRHERRLGIPTRGGIECLDLDCVRYVETLRKGLNIHLIEREIYCGKTMVEMEALLKQKGFFRCHQAFLINLLHVRKVEAYIAYIEKEAIPVSRHRKRELLDALANFMGENMI